MIEQIAPHPVTVRTWDVGPEDIVPGGPTSANPALGERALRLMRRAPEPFRAQLRALLRAGRHGALRIMFPFVTGPSDLRLVLGLLEVTREGLRRDGIPFAPDVPIGLMLEVPSAAFTADLLAPHVQFFAVGTNDLIQYLLAVDRVDPRVSSLYEPLHPAVLRTIDGVVRAAAPHGVPVSICGEMAADPLQALLLVGLGVRELSMSPAAIPAVKAAVRAATGCPPGAGRAREPLPGHGGGDRGYASTRAGGGADRPRLFMRSPGLTHTPKRVEKPWGFELWWARTDRYVGKLLHLRKGESLSLQYHRVKDETIMLQSGRLLFETRPKDENGELRRIEMKPGDVFHITPGTLHRMTGLEDCDIVEVSTPELDDVVRIEDRYGRAGTSKP